jgi:hypothetical protein
MQIEMMRQVDKMIKWGDPIKMQLEMVKQVDKMGRP